MSLGRAFQTGVRQSRGKGWGEGDASRTGVRQRSAAGYCICAVYGCKGRGRFVPGMIAGVSPSHHMLRA